MTRTATTLNTDRRDPLAFEQPGRRGLPGSGIDPVMVCDVPLDDDAVEVGVLLPDGRVATGADILARHPDRPRIILTPPGAAGLDIAGAVDRLRGRGDAKPGGACANGACQPCGQCGQCHQCGKGRRGIAHASANPCGGRPGLHGMPAPPEQFDVATLRESVTNDSTWTDIATYTVPNGKKGVVRGTGVETVTGSYENWTWRLVRNGQPLRPWTAHVYRLGGMTPDAWLPLHVDLQPRDVIAVQGSLAAAEGATRDVYGRLVGDVYPC